MKARKPRGKRLIFDVDDKLHQIIKLKATERNISIKDYCIQAIWERIEKEKQYE